MEPVVDTLLEEPEVVVEPLSEATRASDSEGPAEELVETLLAEITIDGMCGVY